MRTSLVAAALLVSSAARARGIAEVEPPPAVVHGVLEGTVAVFTVRYAIPVKAGTYGPSIAGIELPAGGLVTGATVTTNGVSHPLGLVPAAQATAAFEALGAEGGEASGERTNAVTITSDGGYAEIGIAAAHAGTLTLEVTVSAPACFFRDARYVRVPARWRTAANFALRRVPIDPAALEEACGDGITTGDDAPTSWIGLADREQSKKASGDRVGASAARLVLGGHDHVVRVELDVAGVLGDVPRDLATVLLVDGSRSMSTDQLEVQRQLVASYLRAAPRSRVQILAYARRTTALVPAWTTAAQAAARLDRSLRGLALRNGSNFDVALADAASRLETVTGTRRIVLFTDERMANRLEEIPPATLRRVLPPGTLVQVVVIDERAKELVRDEAAMLASLAAATDGMAVRAGPLAEREVHDATMLVRPTSLDDITITAPGWTAIGPASGREACGREGISRLREGESCTWWGEGESASGPVVVAGLVWGKRVVRMLRPDPTRARDVARELSASGDTPEKARARVDELARAVNAHWSLYGAWGGTAKYAAPFGFGRAGFGSSCCDRGIGDPGPRRGVGTIGETPVLTSQLRPLFAACHVDDASITVTLELTLVEIVDLTVSIARNTTVSSADQRAQQTCVEDALWDSAPVMRRVEPHTSVTVTLPPVH